MLSNKVVELAESARYDVCLSSCSSGVSGNSGRVRKPGNPLHEWIYPASVPGQGTVHILKILQSNRCTNNCKYCKFAVSNGDIKRSSLTPDELAGSFMKMVRSRLVEGIFLSSGVCGSPSNSMEEMIKTASILRKQYRFGGYIHLKIIPGAALHLIDEAAKLADRLSVNMEAPTPSRLQLIAPDKSIENQILPAAARITELLQAKKNEENKQPVKTTGQTTQFVVGAANEPDIEILSSVDYLYRDFFMFRSYFSAFQKTSTSASLELKNNSGLKAFSGSPLLREHRLYQCDFLLRAYGFRFHDLVFDSMGNIPLETDPKTAWAVLNPKYFPVEINSAGLNKLLMVPGIGPITAEKIIKMRQNGRINDIETLKQSGAWTKRAAGWIELNGRTPFITDEPSTKRISKIHGFNPSQKWLFEEIAPEGWQSAKNSSTPGSDTYAYPGQKGKWVNYQFKKTDKKVWCQ